MIAPMKIKHNIIYNLKWPYIPNSPYRILIIGGSGSGEKNALLSLINIQPDTDKIYLYAKDPYEAKYQNLIHKEESIVLKHFNNPKLLLSIQVICRMFTKILMNTMRIKNAKY